MDKPRYLLHPTIGLLFSFGEHYQDTHGGVYRYDSTVVANTVELVPMRVDVCVYCGAEFDRDDSLVSLRDHVQECSKHPLTKTNTKVEKLTELLEQVRQVMVNEWGFAGDQGQGRVTFYENAPNAYDLIEEIFEVLDEPDDPDGYGTTNMPGGWSGK